MNDIVYVSENKIFTRINGKTQELPSERVIKYKKSIEAIRKRNDWKTSGKGAQFMGVNRSGGDVHEATAYISGISKYEDGFVYSINLDGIGAMYKKSTDKESSEGHITVSDKIQIRDIDIKENKCTASIGGSSIRNLALFELPSGNFTELTEGDTKEDFPSFSKSSNTITFSSAGLARNQNGTTITGPYAAMKFDLDRGEMEELFSDENFDFIRIKEDSDGNIYCIKRPYGGEKNENFLIDFFLFPWRMVRAVFGFFNYFSVLYGGESLRSNKDPQSANTKMKQKSERELFIDGNVINAEQTYKINKQKGEKFPGLIPLSWELIRIVDDGYVCLKRGVLDYTLCENGDIIYSNGQAIVKISGGKEELIEKCRLANCIVEL
ncbi:MAG: hypothetical protein FWD34_03955 [Oscillospiraceae bacterium]|nr:hypothetical protein [Oscillospiraceae bacterium]